uniref:NADPH-dependent FMN reductase n=1 Tax=Castellaniella defragrans TaxID=75697 RepID=UPI00333FB701
MSIRVLAIGGSLRKNSYNHRLLEQARRLAPEGMTIELADLADVPLYNGDVEAAAGVPEAVSRIGAQIGQADAVLIATPEYNYSIPGVLKNAIDWLSRLSPNPLKGKPLALASASMGGLGGSRAQYHLRQVLVFLDPMILNKPELFIAAAHEKFSPEGELTDPTARAGLVALLQALADRAAQQQAGAAAVARAA